MVDTRDSLEIHECLIEIPAEGERPDIRLFPCRPGVYHFMEPDGTVLYVGKARNLRDRVGSYFRSAASLPARTKLMLSRARAMKLVVTDSEKEALILEAELISQLKPRYNIRLRDDKAYPFLRLSIGSKWPRLSMVRKRRNDSSLYFGPYTSSSVLRNSLQFLGATFRLRRCSDHVMKARSRPCLLYQINRCSAPCCGLISHEEYLQLVKDLQLFLQGRTNDLVVRLKKDMARAAEALEFEKAAVIRDQIKALRRTVEAQAVVGPSRLNLDAVALYGSNLGQEDSQIQASSQHDFTAAVLSVRQGRVTGCSLFGIVGRMGEPGSQVLSLFLRQYYQDLIPPGEILLNLEPEDIQSLSEMFAQRRGARVHLLLPKRGKKKVLLERAKDNARQGFLRQRRKDEGWRELAALLAVRLNLQKEPNIIETIDISTFGGEATVGSLVRFEYGQGLKEGYRIFRIRNVQGVDDYGSIQELLIRRIRNSSKKGLPLPDLFVIDGGRGQLSVAIQAVNRIVGAKRCEFIALAKDRHGTGEKIFLSNEPEPVMLPVHDPVLRFLQTMRDEAHRFGIRRNRKNRIKARLSSPLSHIPGIGPVRQRALLARFGSLEGLKQADPEEIASEKGITMEMALRIKAELHNS